MAASKFISILDDTLHLGLVANLIGLVSIIVVVALVVLPGGGGSPHRPALS